MNKLSKSLIVLFLVFFIGSYFSVCFVQAQSNELNLKVTKECDIQYMGEDCIVEMKITNNTGEILDGEAIFSVKYNNQFFDGIGIDSFFSINNEEWINFADWQNGSTATIEIFTISQGESFAQLRIETHPALYPGQYDFTLTLKGTTEEGEEHIAAVIVSGGGGGDGGLPSGLTISYEPDFYIGATTVKITWLTSYKSTSRVIYGTQPGVFDLNDLPDYGYDFSTTEQDTPAEDYGVVSHEVWLSNLLTNTTYYYRAISHASPPTISREYSFITLVDEQGQEDQERDRESEREEEQIQAEEGGFIKELISLAGSAVDLITGVDLEADEEDLDQELVSPELAEDPSVEPSNLLAAIGGLVFNFRTWLVIIAVVLLALFFLRVVKKKKRN